MENSSEKRQLFNNDGSMRELVMHYDHTKRQCFMETKGGEVGVELAFAKQAYLSGRLTDHNLALRQLAIHDWDMEAVEAYYRECDKRKIYHD